MQSRNVRSVALGGLLLLVLATSSLVTAFSSQPGGPGTCTDLVQSAADQGQQSSFTDAQEASQHQQPVMNAAAEAWPSHEDQRAVWAGESAARPEVRPLLPTPETTGSGPIRPAQDGTITGRLVVLDSERGRIVPAAAEIYLLRGGEILTCTHSDVHGFFRAKLHPGCYSVIVLGQDGLAVSGIEILSPPAGETDSRITTTGLAEETGGRETLELAVVPISNSVAVARILGRFLPPGLQETLLAETRGTEPKTDGRQILATQSVSTNQAGGYAIRLQADGSLVGRMRRIESQSGRSVAADQVTVSFVRDGRVHLATEVDANGLFTAQGLQPGVYSVVAAGEDGFSAFDVEVLPPCMAQPTADLGRRSVFRTVSSQRLLQDRIEAFELNGSLVESRDIEVVLAARSVPDVPPAPDEPMPEYPVEESGMGGAAGGGGAFGGVSVGGLAGALLGAGAGIGLGAAIFNDDDSPASPSRR